MAAQVQVNFRLAPEMLAELERQRGSVARNAWVLEAVAEKLERGRGVDPVRVSPGLMLVTAPRGAAERAPQGCRVVGVSRAARAAMGEPPALITGQIDLEGTVVA